MPPQKLRFLENRPFCCGTKIVDDRWLACLLRRANVAAMPTKRREAAEDRANACGFDGHNDVQDVFTMIRRQRQTSVRLRNLTHSAGARNTSPSGKMSVRDAKPRKPDIRSP